MGIVAVTLVLSLFIWAPKFSIKPSCLSVKSFSFKILTSTSYYLLLNLPIVWGVNTLVMLLAKVEKNAMKPIWISWKKKSILVETLFLS